METLHQKLAGIQQKLNAPKNLFNKFGNYKYRNCEGILEAVKPLLGDCTLVLTDEPVQIGERYYIKATAVITDGTHNESFPESPQLNRIEVTAFAREPENKKGMDESQITGASSSYARKYALNGLFLIDDTKDADETNRHETITAQQIGYLEQLFNNSSVQNTPQGNKLQREFSDMSVDRYDKAVSYLQMHQLHESERLPNTATGTHL